MAVAACPIPGGPSPCILHNHLNPVDLSLCKPSARDRRNKGSYANNLGVYGRASDVGGLGLDRHPKDVEDGPRG